MVKQVQAGNEVLLTQGRKLMAKIISASEKERAFNGGLPIRLLKGHRIITPKISQFELADEKLGHQ